MKHKVDIQLRFNDADSLGHINNSVYLTYFDLGKTEYFNTVRGFNYLERKVDIVVAHIDVNFIKPVFLNDKVAVETAVTKIGNKSLNLEQQIICCKSGEIKCKCNTTMVGIDFQTEETIRINDEWRKDIAAYEENLDFLN